MDKAEAEASERYHLSEKQPDEKSESDSDSSGGFGEFKEGSFQSTPVLPDTESSIPIETVPTPVLGPSIPIETGVYSDLGWFYDMLTSIFNLNFYNSDKLEDLLENLLNNLI